MIPRQCSKGELRAVQSSAVQVLVCSSHTFSKRYVMREAASNAGRKSATTMDAEVPR